LAAVAVTIAMSGSATPALTSHGTPHTGGPAGTAAGGAPAALSARQILLTAAVNAAKAPSTGRYWVVRQRDVDLQQAGTAAHPYDITESYDSQQWDPRKPSWRSWTINKYAGAAPATAADTAAWRAVGAPKSWIFGGRYGKAKQHITVHGTAAQGWWWPGNNSLGYLGMTKVTLDRLRRLPARPAALEKVIRRAAVAQDGGAGRSRVKSWSSDCGLPHMVDLKTGSRAQRRRLLRSVPRPAVCARLARDGTRYVQYGIRYPDQVSYSSIYLSYGWTNASPNLPKAQFGPSDGQG
jgi:hypothetical protein